MNLIRLLMGQFILFSSILSPSLSPLPLTFPTHPPLFLFSLFPPLLSLSLSCDRDRDRHLFRVSNLTIKNTLLYKQVQRMNESNGIYGLNKLTGYS